MKPIVFWGSAGQARVLHEFVASLGYQLVALFDNDPGATSPFPGVPLYYGRSGFERWWEQHGGVETACLVAVGGARGGDRVELQRSLQARGLDPIVAIHPKAFVAASASVSQGSQILAHASVCASAVVGEACIVNTAATVDHECVLDAGVHVAPGATLAGCVTVGARALVGVGAVVLPRIAIGHDSIIGAGAVVTRDVPAGVVVYGNPATVRRPVQSSEGSTQ